MRLPRMAVTLACAGLAVVLLMGAARLFYGAYRRVETILTLQQGALEAPGSITEKLIQQRRESLPPFALRVYVVRYTYPTPPLGQVRADEQVVTRGFFEQIGEPGAPVTVTFAGADPRVAAVDPRLVFPAHAGWWFTGGLLMLMGGAALIPLEKWLARRLSG